METLIIHTQDLIIAEKLTISLKGDLEKRKNHFRIHTNFNFTIEKLRLENIVDINLHHKKFNFSDIKLVVSDMDSTLITIETIDEIAKESGMSSEVALITEQAMQGNLDFTESFKKRVSILKGVNTSAFESVYTNSLKLSPGAKELVNFFKSTSVKSAIISGGLSYFAERLHKSLGVDTFRANNVEVINSCLTGEVLGKVIDANEKANYINELCSLYQIKREQVIAIGDGANDLQMMKIAGVSVAFHAKPILQKNCDVIINYGGLDSVIDFFEEDGY
ncbi:phosphoserine phosphatase SerB [Candidatus Thioglobus sp.]|nr:phosphoserine phosphatase SerB [Candidatus Thioglobus sp.]